MTLRSTKVDIFRSHSDEAERLYSLAVIKKIETKLPRFRDSDAQKRFRSRIKGWAGRYLTLKNLLQMENAQHRAALGRLADAAAALTDAAMAMDNVGWLSVISNLPQESGLKPLPPASGVRDLKGLYLYVLAQQRLNQTLDGIVSLEHGARAAFKQIARPKAGRPKSPLHRIIVEELYTIYFEATGERPTRTWDPVRHRFYGRFRDFVVAAMFPVEGSKAEIGIDAVVEDIFKRQGSSSSRA